MNKQTNMQSGGHECKLKTTIDMCKVEVRKGWMYVEEVETVKWLVKARMS